MNKLVEGFQISERTQLIFQEIMHELPPDLRETLISGMASYSAELQIHITGKLLEGFRHDLSRSLRAMLSVLPQGGGNGSAN